MKSTKGFTLTELLLVISLIGILGAIAIPSWLNLSQNQKVKNAQNTLYSAMLTAKSYATQKKVTYQVSFREQDDIAQWSIHSAKSEPTEWHSLAKSVEIDDQETTFYEKDGVWRIQFNYKGHVNGQLGRITLSINGEKKHCIFGSTLIGAMRRGKQRSQPKNGKYCY